MTEQTVANPSRRVLKARLTAFEAAWQHGEPNLVEYVPPADESGYLEVLRELIRRDLRERWQHGHPVRLEHYRTNFPEFFTRAEELTDAAFEEYRQRALTGEKVVAEDYRRSYGIDVTGWPPPEAITPQAPGLAVSELVRDLGLLGNRRPLSVDATLALRRLARARHRLPHAGDRVLDFVLLRELGRGSFARVFLARQTHLADRPVVLKISPSLDDEPRTLAQLQHTNIVPIYSVHQAGPLQVVCMPYFGSITLAKVMHDLGRSGERLPATGREFLAVLFQQTAPGVPETTAPHSPASLERLATMSYVDAVLSLTVQIADALAHAHERSILHCDLKPENILLTADGQPMLLDFNVSVDSKIPAELRMAQIGGTIPYMAPERLRLIRNPRTTIDGRSDLYSLGVILYRLLTGFAPYDPIPGAPLDILDQVCNQRKVPPIAPRRLNPAITPAVDAIVRKLLQSDPNHRYAQAAHLSEDLERQLSNRPLRYARDPSPLERLRKWWRRHPL